MEIQPPSAAAKARESFVMGAAVLWSVCTVSSTSELKHRTAAMRPAPPRSELTSPNRRSRASFRWPPGAQRSHSHGD